MSHTWALVLEFNGGCGEEDYSPPEIIKVFKFQETIQREEVGLRMASWAQAEPDDLMRLWEVLGDFLLVRSVENPEVLPDFLADYIGHQVEDESEVVLNILGAVHEASVDDLMELFRSDLTITTSTSFCHYHLNIHLIPIGDSIISI